MIHSTVFQKMPAEMKQRVYRRLGQALSEGKPDPAYSYLPWRRSGLLCRS
ncbi:hypothetical protein [Verrucomicrobium spinosum]|nr:hypothetical protein [Verrucomicrobium spinosum]